MLQLVHAFFWYQMEHEYKLTTSFYGEFIVAF